MKDILSELTKGLGSYNKSVNTSMNAVNKSLTTVGYLLVSILFLIEMLSWYRFIRNQGGEMTWKLFLEIAAKYLIAYFLVAESGAILNSMMWFANGVTKTLGADLSGSALFEYNQLKKGNFIIRHAVNIIALLISGASVLSLKVLTFLRFIELYFYKGIAPIIVAFWMSDALRSIAINLLKTFAAIALQGAVIVLMLTIWEGFRVDTVFQMSNASWLGQFAPAFSYIGKCVVFLILLFGTQRKAKQLLQVS